MSKTFIPKETNEGFVYLYDFIFSHEDFYEMRLQSKYLFCVLMFYMDQSEKHLNESSITVPKETLANELQTTERSITNFKNELVSYGLIEDTFMGIGKVNKININQDKVNQYTNSSGNLDFMLLPKVLFDTDELSIASKILYAFMVKQSKRLHSDSISLSNDDIKNLLNVSLSKARKSKKELVNAGKIEEQRRGHATPNTIQIIS